MNRFLKVAFCCLLASLAVLPAQAAKPFYDSKSWIVNVAGDPSFLISNGFESKVNPVALQVPHLLNQEPTAEVCREIAADLTERGIGKEMIDALTGNGMNDAVLRRLALANAQRQDVELGTSTMRFESGDALDNLLADDYLPILMHNYIVLTYTQTKTDSKGKVSYKYYYAIFHVDINAEEAFDIVSSISDPSRYSRLKYPVSVCAFGEASTPEKTEKKIAKSVPGLAVRGVLLKRNPARISIGKNAGLKKGDLVSIYSQRVDKNGNNYSKRISRARVCGVWDNEAQVNFEANTAGNRKNGDVVVRTPDSKSRVGLMATYTPHVWGGQILLDTKSGFARSGIVHHFLMDFGFSMTDKPGTKFIRLDDLSHEYKAPMFFNFGMGYGLSKTFVGFFDFMPFFLVQYELAPMIDFDSLKDSLGENPSDDGGKMPLGSAVRIPLGLRFSFNMGYPVRLALEAGYAFNFGIGDDYKIVKQACDYLGAKRNGAFINLGLTF